MAAIITELQLTPHCVASTLVAGPRSDFDQQQAFRHEEFPTHPPLYASILCQTPTALAAARQASGAELPSHCR